MYTLSNYTCHTQQRFQIGGRKCQRGRSINNPVTKRCDKPRVTSDTSFPPLHVIYNRKVTAWPANKKKNSRSIARKKLQLDILCIVHLRTYLHTHVNMYISNTYLHTFGCTYVYVREYVYYTYLHTLVVYVCRYTPTPCTRQLV